MNTVTTQDTPGSANVVAVELSIVIPVFNEASRISASHSLVDTFIGTHGIDAEIILVDDGSTDSTAEVIAEISARHVRTVALSVPHTGKAGAVLAGMAISHGDVVGFVDADMATPLETWFTCRDTLASGAGVAIASREGSGAVRIGEPWYRHVMGRAFNRLVRILLLPGIDDTQCGFKFFRRDVIDQILPRCQLYRHAVVDSVPRVTAFDVELLYIARTLGHRIAVVPMTWTFGSHSKVNPVTDTLQNLRDVLLVRWNGWRGRYK